MKGYGVSLTGLPSGKTSDPVIPREGVESDVGCYEGWAGCPSLCVIPREGVESRFGPLGQTLKTLLK